MTATQHQRRRARRRATADNIIAAMTATLADPELGDAARAAAERQLRRAQQMRAQLQPTDMKENDR